MSRLSIIIVCLRQRNILEGPPAILSAKRAARHSVYASSNKVPHCSHMSLNLQVFEVDDRKAWSAVLLTTCSVLASIALIAYSPWYLLPLAWVFAGTAWTGVSYLEPPSLVQCSQSCVVGAKEDQSCLTCFLSSQ